MERANASGMTRGRSARRNGIGDLGVSVVEKAAKMSYHPNSLGLLSSEHRSAPENIACSAPPSSFSHCRS